MKFCSPHWEQLRIAVKDKGMWGLVSASGEEATERMSRAIKSGVMSPADYDPLLSAHNMIVNNAVQCGGIYLLQGDFCPLCELNRCNIQMGEKDSDWIEKATNGCLDYCKENGLVQVQ